MLGYIDRKTAHSTSSIRFMASYWFARMLKGLKILTLFSFSVCLFLTNFVGKTQSREFMQTKCLFPCNQ